MENLRIKTKKDKITLKNLLFFLYDLKGTPNEFIEYLNQALDKDNIFDFSKYGEDNIIELDNYIIEFLKKDKIKNKKHKLKNKYKDNHIITYEEFINIILEDNENKVFMKNDATEYLLYKMKKSLINDNINLNSYDINIFLDYFDKQPIFIKDNDDNIF